MGGSDSNTAFQPDQPIDEQWLNGESHRIFEGFDTIIDILNGNSQNEEIEDIPKVIPHHQVLNKNDSIIGDARAGYEAVTSGNVWDDPEKLLNDERNNSQIDYREDGKLYHLSFREFLEPTEKSNIENRIEKTNLENLNFNLNLLTVHTIVYEDTTGTKYIVHSDPGVYNSNKDIEKIKFETKEENYAPNSLEPAQEHELENPYMDFQNFQFEEGLEYIENYVRDMSEELYEKTDKLILEQSNKSSEDMRKLETTAWHAERWRAMADAIETFRKRYRIQKEM